MIRATSRPLDLALRDPFTISRSTRRTQPNVLVELQWRDLTGYGEAAPSSYYGETPETVAVAVERLSHDLGADPYDIDAITRRWDVTLRGNAAARAALESALLDLIGKDTGRPAWRLLGLNPTAMPPTSFTIGIDEPDVMARKAAAAGAFRVLKVKIGTGHDEANLRAIRAVRPDARIRVDANAAWTGREAVRQVERLLDFDLEFVEQPVAAHDLDGLRFVRERLPVPVLADESCRYAEDLPRLAGRVDGVVLKVAKHGGPLTTLHLAAIARSFEMQIMIGCMIESSAGIAAGCLIGPRADYADLDGNLLLAADPFSGLELSAGCWNLPSGPGLGIAPTALA